MQYKSPDPAPSKSALSAAQAKLAAKLQQGLTFHQHGEFARAQSVYAGILKIQPEHFDALHYCGLIGLQTGDFARAAEFIARAIAVEPFNAAAHANLGTAFLELQQYDASLASYDRAIAIQPVFAEAHSYRGLALQRLKHLHAALSSQDRAIVIKHDYAEAHFNRGNVLEELQQWNAALASYDRAIAIDAAYADAYLNRGNVLMQLEHWDAALASFERVMTIKPDCAAAFYNRGNVFKKLGRLDAALASYDQAIALKGDYVEAYTNRGVVLHDLARFDAALASYDHAIAIRADWAEAHVNKALTSLLGGDFANGWMEFEWRWRDPTGTNIKEKRNFQQPLWRGQESLAGKTVLLHSEQGLGDTLQFCRYVKLVSEVKARVILEVQEPLMSFLTGLSGVSKLVARGDVLPEFDYHCPLLSLPLAFKTDLGSIPATAHPSVDKAKTARWQRVLGEKRRPRIGLAWSGNSVHKNDVNRSIELAQLMAHLPRQFQYVSLQKDVRERDQPTLQANREILNLADELHDFAETAALCECLDLVITVDTSVAHLSGATGTKTWILLPFVPDWRWLLDRCDSPWYPSTRLYRQKQAGDWGGLLGQVRSDLIQSFTSSGHDD